MSKNCLNAFAEENRRDFYLFGSLADVLHLINSNVYNTQPVASIKMICPYFSKCGGCFTQHIDYETQLENKKELVKRSLQCEDVKVFSDNPFEYRNRMDFIIYPGGIGFRKKGSASQEIDINKCIISNNKLNILLKEVRDFFSDCDAFYATKHIGTFRYAVIRTPTKSSSVSFVLNSDSSRLKEAIEKVKEFSKITSAENVIITYTPKMADVSISDDFFAVKGSGTLHETLVDKEFNFSVQGFFQNNTIMAEKMLRYVSELLEKYPTKDANLLDLYGGVGTFGIINSDKFKEVTIVENFEQSIISANDNIELNKIENTKALVLDAKQLTRLRLNSPLYIITDPPRSGMDQKTISQINDLKPEVIIYISCNPKIMGKEVAKFKKYQIKSVAMFDLFPQTNHCETVVELVKENIKK
jgi:23S rRNA (uracil-5-)-methyltransferase RumA